MQRVLEEVGLTILCGCGRFVGMHLLQSIFEWSVCLAGLAFLAILAAQPLIWLYAKLRSWWIVSRVSEQEDQARHETLPPLERATELVFGSERQNAVRELKAMKPEKIRSKALLGLFAWVGLLLAGYQIFTWLGASPLIGLLVGTVVWVSLMSRQAEN